MTHGVDANLARRWVIDATEPARELIEIQHCEPQVAAPKSALPPPFVPAAMPSTLALLEIRVELRRGSTAISVSWPVAAAAECAAWMRELPR